MKAVSPETTLPADPSAGDNTGDLSHSRRLGAFRKFYYFLEYALIRLLGGLLNSLPFAFVLRLARPVGHLLFRFLNKSRERALSNLRLAYGREIPESEIQQIAKGSFRYVVEFGVEWLRLPRIAKNPDRYLESRTADLIHSALKQGRGALLLLSHGGNWEIMALMGGLFLAKPVGATIYALARPVRNPYLYDRILALRGLTGLKSIRKIGAVRETFKRLKENAIVCTLMDQRIDEGSVEADFFGQKALTTSLPALCALRLGTPVFYVFLRRPRPLRYVLEVEGPAPISETGNFDEDIRTNTQRFNDRIETEIRKDPARWLWMHHRWRSKHGAKD